MENFVILCRFTREGITHLKDSPTRVTKAKEMLKKYGVNIKDFYLVMGEYDTVLITEAPNSEAVAKGCLALGSLGNVGTETLRAFTEKEYQHMVQEISTK